MSARKKDRIFSGNSRTVQEHAPALFPGHAHIADRGAGDLPPVVPGMVHGEESHPPDRQPWEGVMEEKGKGRFVRGHVFPVVALVACMALPPLVCAEDVVYRVWPGADGDCADNECNLQAALDAAENAPGVDHEIRLAQGTYSGNYQYLPAGDHTGALVLSGGWTQSSAFTARTIDPTNTVLNGNGTGSVLRLNTYPGSRVLGDITVEGVTLRQGVAGGAAGGVDSWGGGLFALTNSTATLAVRRNILENNRAGGAGGGCLLLAGGPVDGGAEGTLYLEGTIIRRNVATGYMDGADPESGEGGGCDIIVRGQAIIRNNLVHDNRAGGADSGQTFAGFGGGLLVEITKGSIHLVNNTLTANQAFSPAGSSEGDGGGLYLMTDEEAAPATATLSNSIFYGNFHNRADAGKDIRIGAYNGTVTISHCDYGSKTQTVIPVEIANIQSDPRISSNSNSLFYLTFGSPCVDAGDNTALYMPATDLAGEVRPGDGNNDGTAITNMGCYEKVVEEDFSWSMFLPAINAAARRTKN